MFRFIEKHFHPEKFERPCDINGDALEDARRALARTELQIEQFRMQVDHELIRRDILKARIARIEAMHDVVGPGL